MQHISAKTEDRWSLFAGCLPLQRGSGCVWKREEHRRSAIVMAATHWSLATTLPVLADRDDST